MRRVTVETMGRVAIRLPPWAPADLVCSGEITRIDIIPNGGLAGWLFRNDDVRGWHQELRMPLIQDTLAHEMGLDVEEITVGVYGFQQQVVDQRTYSVGEVQAAYSRLDDLLGQLGF